MTFPRFSISPFQTCPETETSAAGWTSFEQALLSTPPAGNSHYLAMRDLGSSPPRRAPARKSPEAPIRA
jgi:hypothetical protein